MSEEKKRKIIFEPGCFDNFTGTQEELDELIAEINRLVETGEFFKNSIPIDLDMEMSTDSNEPVNIESVLKKPIDPKKLH